MAFFMALAIFDLDNTLINGDSDYLWGVYLSKIGVVDRDTYEKTNEKFFAQYSKGELDINEFLNFSLRPLVENKMDDLLTWRADFIEKIIKPKISLSAKKLVDNHRAMGDILLVITATNTFITQPIVDLFHIENLIGIELEVKDNKFTGKTLGIPSFKEGKVKRLFDWLTKNSTNIDGAYFYSDSSNDLPLLSIVDNPVAVNPDENLRQYAKNSGWKIINLQDKNVQK
tara:strand:- start:252 stop:935 length:684 start_codon:yes stop_codon:yes gene_type:complete